MTLILNMYNTNYGTTRMVRNSNDVEHVLTELYKVARNSYNIRSMNDIRFHAIAQRVTNSRK